VRVAFRVDSGTAIGAGHLVRCLTLADELRDRGADVHFVTRKHPGHFAELARERKFRVSELPGAAEPTPDPATWIGTSQEADAADTLHVTEGAHPLDWTIVDHYALDATWHRMIRPATRGILAVDDLADRALAVDAVLDHNYDATRRDYRAVAPAARLLLGSRYCLLPRTIRAMRSTAQGSTRPRGEATIVVSLGGSDPSNATTAVLTMLHDVLASVHHVDVVIGRAHPAQEAVAEGCQALTNATLHVQTDLMGLLLARADVAIGAGGTSTWERLHLGVPSIVLPLAANQVPTIQALAETGLVLTPGTTWRVSQRLVTQLTRLLDDTGERALMAERGRAAIDGQGAERVADALRAWG
jgi:UDP-2,4-diacetamido-2,4,6-trideoxy-beta-L-altropyranose hydrolase